MEVQVVKGCLVLQGTMIRTTHERAQYLAATLSVADMANDSHTHHKDLSKVSEMKFFKFCLTEMLHRDISSA